MFGFFNKKPKIKAVEITAENFREIVLQNDKPVLLDFWAAWCRSLQNYRSDCR